MSFKNLKEEELIKLALDNDQFAHLTKASRYGLERKLTNYSENNGLVLNEKNQLVSKTGTKPLVVTPNNLAQNFAITPIDKKNATDPPIAVGASFMCSFFTKLDYKSKFIF